MENEKMRPSFLRALLLVAPLAIAASGCNSNNTAVTTPTVLPVLTTDTFEGALVTGGANYHLVTAKVGNVVTTMTGIGLDPTVRLGMAIGVNDLISCTAVMDEPNATIGSTLTGVTTAVTNLCVKVYDPGTVAADATVSYEVKVTYYK
jgi:hypothetical protein